MKLSSLVCVAALAVSPVFAESTEWRIDFGKSAYNSNSNGSEEGRAHTTRTTEAGWNNVSATGVMTGGMAWDEATQSLVTKWDNQYFESQYAAGSTDLANVFFAEKVEGSDSSTVQGKYEEWAKKEVAIYDTKGNEGSTLKLSINKDSDTGFMDTMCNFGSGMHVTEAGFARFNYDIPENMPSTAYGDFIYGHSGAAFTLTLTGFAEGCYDITVLGGMNKASGGDTPTVSYTLNGETLTLTGDDSGVYAGVLTWKNITLGADDALVLSVAGLEGVDAYGTATFATAALNAMVISESPAVPEPATASLSLLALCGLAARRRRC